MFRGYEEACRDLRIRYFQTCNKRKGSRTVVILRMPCSNQDTERCSNVRWSCFYLPWYLLRERLKERHHHRAGSTGIGWPLYHEASYGKIRTYSFLQPAVLRWSGLGNTWRCGYRRRRTFHGYKVRLPFPAHLREHGTGSGAKPYRIIFFQTSGSIQGLCGTYLYWYKFHPVRERWRYETGMGRWLCHLLLCICYTDR